MLTLKMPLVAIITLLFAVVTYFINLEFNDTSIAYFLPSILILLFGLSLMLLSMLINKESAAVGEADVEDNNIATLYIGNLAYKANEQTVQEHFENIGFVKSVRLVKDKKTGRRKGFGFIEVAAKDQPKFIKKFNDSIFMERNLIVRLANDKQY
ncbi:RNA recognition motif domain-containing protein [Glaciecola petra]|uniref:RNA-binding protein n=1 Tax=Glaciecola petra TaxID=3075602 RepID=A0ABU2ZYJ8_9ALTE|nr:RNA-binding protein [Aestuariibacter sp. P117]MDT0596512.1 RNA-binding protein [Aestuariibacter sp. P117]